MSGKCILLRYSQSAVSAECPSYRVTISISTYWRIRKRTRKPTNVGTATKNLAAGMSALLTGRIFIFLYILGFDQNQNIDARNFNVLIAWRHMPQRITSWIMSNLTRNTMKAIRLLSFPMKNSQNVNFVQEESEGITTNWCVTKGGVSLRNMLKIQWVTSRITQLKRWLKVNMGREVNRKH